MKYNFSWITFLLSTAGLKIFQQLFAYNRFQIFIILILRGFQGGPLLIGHAPVFKRKVF